MTKQRLFYSVVVVCVLSSSLCFALLMAVESGTWPDSWPKELEPFRKQARTVDVAHGIQETVYEIPFENREAFEKVWGHILKLKSKGAPLILEKSPSTYNVSGSKMERGVLVLCPSAGSVGLPDGTRLHAGPPWPEYIKSLSGELPEYVVHEGGNFVQEGGWVPFDRKKGDQNGFRYRARVDIILVTDGKVIDLNRIPLPPDTPIVDRRFAK